MSRSSTSGDAPASGVRKREARYVVVRFMRSAEDRGWASACRGDAVVELARSAVAISSRNAGDLLLDYQARLLAAGRRGTFSGRLENERVSR